MHDTGPRAMPPADSLQVLIPISAGKGILREPALRCSARSLLPDLHRGGSKSAAPRLALVQRSSSISAAWKLSVTKHAGQMEIFLDRATVMHNLSPDPPPVSTCAYAEADGADVAECRHRLLITADFYR